MISNILTPHWFKKNIKMLIVLFIVFSVLFLSTGLYYSLTVPDDYQHRSLIKMMFIHVPFSWLAMLIYISMCTSLSLFFVKRAVLFDVIALQSAKNGAIFCGLSLITGSLWGKSSWGVFWVWDARLTSMLCLFLAYCAYIVVNDLQEKNPEKHKVLLIFSFIGAINIPIIKLSVEYWNTLHQPASIMRKSGVAIDYVFLKPLFLMFIGFGFFHLLLLSLRIKSYLLKTDSI